MLLLFVVLVCCCLLLLTLLCCLLLGAGRPATKRRRSEVPLTGPYCCARSLIEVASFRIQKEEVVVPLHGPRFASPAPLVQKHGIIFTHRICFSFDALLLFAGGPFGPIPPRGGCSFADRSRTPGAGPLRRQHGREAGSPKWLLQYGPGPGPVALTTGPGAGCLYTVSPGGPRPGPLYMPLID